MMLGHHQAGQQRHMLYMIVFIHIITITIRLMNHATAGYLTIDIVDSLKLQVEARIA